MLKVYKIDESIREKFVIPSIPLEGKEINSLDEFFLNFPYAKKLSYAYLKYSNNKVNGQYLHKLFSHSDQYKWLKSLAHKSLMNDDLVYRRVIEKYVRDPYTWSISHYIIQSALFDAKYLLLNKYQRLAKKSADLFYNVQPTHYVTNFNNLRYYKDVIANNEFFVERYELTKHFFNSILLRGIKFRSNLRVNYMFNYIEIYDTLTKYTVTFYFNDKFEHSVYIMQPRGIGRNRVGMSTDPKKMISLFTKYPELASVNNSLERNYDKIQSYFNDIKELKKNHCKVVEASLASIKRVLTDFKEQNPNAYLKNNRLMAVFVGPRTVEKFNFRFADNWRMRLTKDSWFPSKETLKSNGDWEVVKQRGYSFKKRSLDAWTNWFFDRGLIQFHYTKELPEMTDYFLLAQHKITLYTSMFLKMSSTQSLEFFEEYSSTYEEQLIEYEALNSIGEPLEDCIERNSKIDELDGMNTLFEYHTKKYWPKVYHETRKPRLKSKKKLESKFKLEIDKIEEKCQKATKP